MTEAGRTRLRARPVVISNPAPVKMQAVAAEISIVIPAFNAAETIDETLRSVAAQDGVAWELVVVDDGSSDATVEIVEGWTERDLRVRLIRKAHGGVSATRNAGLAAARGEWVCFLDSDDWLAPNALDRLLTLTRAHEGATVAVGAAARVTPSGGTWPYQSRDMSDAFDVLASHCALVVHSALVRRDVVQELGGFDERLSSSEDWDLWQRIARAGHKFAQTDAVVALYRARPGSLSRQLPRAAEEGLEVLRRGHAADPRVPGAPARYAEGAPKDALPHHRFHYVLWSAARDIAAGGDGLSTVALLGDDDNVAFEPESLGELMAAGMADMAACRPEELTSRWRDLEPALRRMFAAVRSAERLKALAMGAIKARLNGGRAGDDDVLQLEAPSSPKAVGEGDDFAVIQLRARASTLGAVAVPVLGVPDAEDLRRTVTQQARRLPLARALRALRPWRTPSFWTASGRAALNIRGLALRTQRKNPAVLREILRQRLRYALAAGLQASVRSKLSPLARQGGSSRHRDLLAQMCSEAANQPEPRAAQGGVSTAGEARGKRPERARQAQAWETFFETSDPWNYGASEYERVKYEDTLELIPTLPHGAALELACAEGHFTVRLAERVGSLVATDISVNALERAAQRCKGAANVSFRPLDFMQHPLPGTFDLIVCSEVLYYAGEHLRAVAERIAAGLRPGGLLVMAHANQISDEPNATGFDWGHNYGARTIGDVFASAKGLALEHEIRRPLYRVQAFRKLSGDKVVPATKLEHRPLQVSLEPAVARNVVWGGGTSRIAAFGREVTTSLPILMYHRVAPRDERRGVLNRYCVDPQAFETQMSFLRRQGYWGVTPDKLAKALAENRPLPGRAVMITFDDGYEDFAELAWPVLQKHDLAPTLFVVAGKLGGVADWDAQHDRPAPLLTWDAVAALAGQGVSVESHGLSHQAFTGLSVKDVYREMLNSRALLASATGRAPISICYPYGALDPVVEQVAQDCGFELGFSTVSGPAQLRDNPFRLPRVEISGSDDLASFAQKLGHDLSGVTELGRFRTAQARGLRGLDLNAPQIAVIIPAKDAANSIARAVKSALAQPEACEVVVIDDGSADATADIARACDDGTGRLRVLQQPNRGPSAARNAAIEISTAPFICNLDSDDFFLPGRLGDIWRAAGTDWDFVADMFLIGREGSENGPYVRWRDDEPTPDIVDFAHFVDGNITRIAKPRAELGYLKPIMRRSFLDAYDLRFNEGVRVGEDYLLYAEALARGARFRTVRSYGYVAITRRKSLSHDHVTADLAALLQADIALAELGRLKGTERRALRRHQADLRRRWLYRRVLDAKAEGRVAEAAALAMTSVGTCLYIVRQRLRQLTVGGLSTLTTACLDAPTLGLLNTFSPCLAA
jgi:glycosyltransferase involved in cell wall biosynthesis/peptidoglycan/xylan/chitin deacetylase (PgdA/CDA1 family)/ubiquinone/menaquinone biosynthesis C-methylase UbiE